MQKKKCRHRPYTAQKIISKLITDLNVKCKIIKLLKDKIGRNLDDPGYGDDFLDTTPKAWSMKEIIEKLDFIKNFCYAKENVNRMRTQATDWEKNLQKTHLIKNYYSKYAKNS